MSKKILAVASGGGHWKQLMLLSPSFEGEQKKFVTTISGLPEEDGISDFEIVCDSNKDTKLALIKTFLQLFLIILKYQPNVIITTGAAPGLFSILIGRLFFKKTIWVDSIANAEELSLCGKVSRYLAHRVFTQWEHLASDPKVEFRGSLF